MTQEVTKSSEEMVGAALGQSLQPVFANIAEAISKVAECMSEVKSHKEATEAKDKAISDELEACKKSLAISEKRAEIVEAEIKELKSSKAPADIAITSPVDYDRLSYEVKRGSVAAAINRTNPTEEHAKKCLALYQAFTAKYPALAKKHKIAKIINDIETKAFHNSVDANLGGLLNNAPFVLNMIVEESGTSIIRQYANIVSSTSIETHQKYMLKAAQAKIRQPNEEFDDGIAGKFAIKKVTALEVYSPSSVDINLALTASDVYEAVLTQIESDLKTVVYSQLDKYYLGGGVEISGEGRIESIIPDAAYQYEYQENIPDQSYQMQFAKIGFIKSGVNNGVTLDSLNKLALSLPANGKQKRFMCHQSIYHKMMALKDDNGTPYLLNGNGINLFNQQITALNGAEIVINDRLPTNVAIYGDIADAYTISDSFGGYNVLERPAVGTSGVNRILVRIFSTGIITGYQSHRLYKLTA